MKWVSFPGICLFCTLVQLGCNQPTGESAPSTAPNIVWLVAEDQSPEFFPMYGDSTIVLSNLSKLAADGVVYANAYAPVPVCAPARSAIITGMYPTSLGTHNMRTYNAYDSLNQPEIGIPSYSPVFPQGVRMFTEYLREEGYYCTNNSKEDYNFKPSEVAWDASSNEAHWRNRPPGKPFFAVFNFGVTHESQIWQRGSDSLWVDPSKVPVPQYFPDTDTVRHDLAVNYSNLGRLDRQIGEVLEQLREDGLYRDTYIFFYSDHGGPFPRHKRALYESGIRVPFMVKFPANKRAGEVDEQFISFVDLAPTILSLAGIEPPKVIQGRAFLGELAAVKDTAEIVVASADRFDEVYDRLRALRWKHFKYIRNYNPDISNALPVSYREQMPMMREMRSLYENGALTDFQEKWFATPKPEEELYDLRTDPQEASNLASNEAYADTLAQLRLMMDEWILETGDLGRYPEASLLQTWLPQGTPPKLTSLEVVEREDNFELRHPLAGVTLLWRGCGEDDWKFYGEALPQGQCFEAKAIRLGYQDSPILVNNPG